MFIWLQSVPSKNLQYAGFLYEIAKSNILI